MAVVTPARLNINQEEVAYRSAVSEGTFTRIAASTNFINFFQYDTKAFFLNGRYRQGLGQLGVDGLYIFPFNCEIFDVAIFNAVAGSGGTTEIDLKRTTSSGGSFSSIFSTTPKILSTAGNFSYVRVGGSGTGLVAPVLSSSPFNVTAGDAIRVDLIQAQTGAPENCGVILYLKPR